MAKQLIKTYVFTPGPANNGTVKVPGRVSLEQLLLITNTTRNQIIYSFADAAYSGTTAVFVTGDDAIDFPKISQRADGYTIITLAAITTGQLPTDKIQILFEETENGVKIRPWAFGTDAIERMRVSNPKSMIDADFEYGLQPTKWAGYGIMRGYPSIYEYPGVDLTISTIATDYTASSSDYSLITVTTTAAHGITIGQAVNITGLSAAISGFSRADGNFIVYDVPSSTELRYFAYGLVGSSNGQSLLTDVTTIKRGNVYSGASLNTTTATGSGTNPTVITVNFGSNHGLVPGCPIYCRMSGGTNPLNASGNFVITSVPTLSSITFTARSGLVVTPGTPMIYALSNSSVTHRPFDGGVILSCKTPAFGASTVRVSKKYFRYQSGKGLLWSTGTMFKPSYDIQYLAASGITVGSTITCKVDDIDHGLQIGAVVTLSGVLTSGYNGTYTVASIVDDYTFTILAVRALGSDVTLLDIQAKVGLTSWHGAIVRAGCFDDQNGMFWEYTGSILCAVRRNATQQLSGVISIAANSNTVNGTNTRFTQQCKAGDKIVIRGMTYYVTGVTNDTALTVTSDYRGVTNAVGVKASLVQETRIPQSQFNIDKLDGTGPSGTTFDPGKMQMMGIQYTWYGAGFIDYMIRGSDGNWIFAHRIKNNNVNTEAHMRTGNLPVRYSIDNDGSPANCYLTAELSSSGSAIAVNDNTYFPAAGTLYIDNEMISYTGKGGTTTFTGCTRAATLTQWSSGSTRSFTAGSAAVHVAGTGLILVSNTASPTLSHWGSALICDGGFDEDRGYIFNYQRSNIAIGTTPVTAFLIRLAPSVSNSAVGDLGSKDLLNRSQLLLNSVAIQTYGSGPSASQGSIIIEGILNPKNLGTAAWAALNFESAGGQPSLAQVAQVSTWTSGSSAIPGEQVFAFAATPNSDNRLELTELKELTNSPFSGVGTYPNGPDTLAINIRTAVGTTAATILLRWGEAQA